MTKLSTKFARAAKRVTSLVSATAIAVVGLVAASAAPASADVYASNTGAVSTTWSEKKIWTSAATPWTFTVTEDAKQASVRTYATTGNSYGDGHSYADSLVGATLALTGGLYDSSNNLLTTGLYYQSSLGAFGAMGSYPASTPSPCVPAAGCSFAASSANPGSTPTYFYAEKGLGNLTVGVNIQPGNYSYRYGVTVNGMPITFNNQGTSRDTGWPLSSDTNYFEQTGNSVPTHTFPAGSSVRYTQTTCLNTTGLAVNDSVTARWIEDGVVSDPSSIFAPANPTWYLGSQSLTNIANNDPAISNSNTTIALSQNMLDQGLAFSAVRAISSADGQVHTYDLSLQANGQEVSTSCAPAAPGKPSITSISSTYNYGVSIPANTQMFGSSSDQSNSNKHYKWEIIDVADASNVFTSGGTDYVGSANPVTATTSTNQQQVVHTFTEGHSYKVRARVYNGANGLYSPWSELSDAVLASGPAQMAAPTLSAITTNQATVTFPAVANTDNYKLYIYADSNHSVKVATQNNCYVPGPAGSTATCYVNGSFTSGTTYVATVSRNAASNGFYSAESGFSTSVAATSGGGGGGGCSPNCGPPPASLLTIAQTGGGSASPVTIGAEKSFGANVKADGTLTTSPDGKGGLLAASVGTSIGSWKIANLAPTGPSTFVRTVSVSAVMDLGWYGAGQAGWSALGMTMPDGGGSPTWKVFYGLKSSSAITTSTIADSAIGDFCRANAGTSYTMGTFGRDMTNDMILSAATSTPLLYVSCADMMTNSTIDFIVKPGATTVTKVMSLKSPAASVSKPCTNIDVFVNPNAKAAGQAAMVIMTTKSGSVGMNPCMYNPSATTGGRRIATISGAGVAKIATADIPVARVPLASNGLAVGPGYAANTWTGIVYTANKPATTVNISATGAVTAGKKITLDANTVFPQMGGMEVIKTLKNGSVVVQRIGFEGQANTYALGKISATGAVTTGKAVKFTGVSSSDLWAEKNINAPSISEKGILNVYVTTGYSTGTNKYKAFSWKDITS